MLAVIHLPRPDGVHDSQAARASEILACGSHVWSCCSGRVGVLIAVWQLPACKRGLGSCHDADYCSAKAKGVRQLPFSWQPPLCCAGREG